MTTRFQHGAPLVTSLLCYPHMTSAEVPLARAMSSIRCRLAVGLLVAGMPVANQPTWTAVWSRPPATAAPVVCLAAVMAAASGPTASLLFRCGLRFEAGRPLLSSVASPSCVVVTHQAVEGADEGRKVGQVVPAPQQQLNLQASSQGSPCQNRAYHMCGEPHLQPPLMM
jgi:peptidoglycan/LPS O-acetylase OafA/YrhL